jgi:hypothetical protein
MHIPLLNGSLARAGRHRSQQALGCRSPGCRPAQLKGGKAGASAGEIARLKKVAAAATVEWRIDKNG